ncbi:cell division protein FtsQ/DivIB [Metabacillus herbersteinensis]|uniref:Cell division protein DivIB n=1 Tax=Metabacillus herbersteinensis TaxID=283816 RepID=A0ABV6GCH5_9BACI
MEKKVVSLEDRIPKLQQQRKQKSNRRMILFLSVFFILIFLVIYFQSPLSKVASVQVKGNQHVNSDTIIEFSDIDEKTGMWNLSEETIKKSIKNHQEIKDVTLERKFPNSVVLNIVEYKRVAYIEKSGAFSPILENGQVLADAKETYPTDAPIMVNWQNDDQIQVMASELIKVPKSIANSISEIHHTPGKTDPWHITLYMNDGYEVSASVRSFSKKMSAYPSIVGQLEPDVKGVIHLEVGSYFEAYNQTPNTDQEEENEEQDETER